MVKGKLRMRARGVMRNKREINEKFREGKID